MKLICISEFWKVNKYSKFWKSEYEILSHVFKELSPIKTYYDSKCFFCFIIFNRQKQVPTILIPVLIIIKAFWWFLKPGMETNQDIWF